MVVSWVRRLWAGVASVALVLVGAVVGAPVAVADVAPVTDGTPSTVSAQGLPTVQINGVVWKQQIVGDRVYVGGSFTSARPAGAPAGTGEVARSYLLAYDLASGALVTSFAPSLNAQVRDMALSPDGSTLYVVGNFTQINGVARNRIAAFDAVTGELLTGFAPYSNAALSAVAVSSSAVYFSGTLTNVNGVARTGVAAVTPLSGELLPFAPSPAGGRVQAMTVSPDGSQVMLGGSFTSMNGSSNPGYGLARFSSDGSMLSLAANTYIRDAGTHSAILDLESDDSSVFGSGYHFGSGGNVEGTFAVSWQTGEMVWVEDCHGDTYSVAPSGNEVYAASHKHYCGNSGGFPQTTPWTYHRGTATGKVAKGVNTPDIYGYPDHDGESKPELLYWFPDINAGTYTGQSQGPWTVAANEDYVLYGGEFTQVNGVGQQGLVRFARTTVASSTDGPVLTGSAITLTANPFVAGRVKVSWPQNWDRDDETLTYKLYRGSISPSNLIWSQTATTPFWKPGDLKTSYIDTGLTSGDQVRYRLEVIDSQGNIATSNFATAIVGDTPVSAYVDAVQADLPKTFWRLGDAAGSATTIDWQGNGDGSVGSSVTLGAGGAISGDVNTAAHFSGTTSSIVVSPASRPAPQVFTIEAWFRSTSTAGGRIIGYGNRASGNSNYYDRHIYLTTDGRVNFGVYNAASSIVTSPKAYNDGQWHQVVASLGPGGQNLYIDGQLAGRNLQTKSADPYDGYWRVGGDSTWAGAQYFTGDVDDVTIYDTVLTPNQVDAHWVASGRSSAIVQPPADPYGTAVFEASPILYWRLGESGSTAYDSGPFATGLGTYRGTKTTGVDGALVGVDDDAVTFSSPEGAGEHGYVSSNLSYRNPTVYSEELWFQTATTAGGKLIGFGNAQTGLSSVPDRHVYMLSTGQIAFGTKTEQRNIAVSAASYNDGTWHHLVATQSSAGMVLYVDGVVVATNSQTSSQNFTGYWRVGGDATWSGDPWFDGTIDEVAIYDSALSLDQVGQHYAAGREMPNHAPIASFTASTDDLIVNVDATASSDSDGNLVEFHWDFGDGATGEFATTSHTYEVPGTYTVALTVVDDKDAIASTNRVVTVTAPNQAPIAEFTATASGLSVDLDGQLSTDVDGSTVNYDWTLGDGGTAEGLAISHDYLAPGTYLVTLTVTDDDGATGVVQHAVTVSVANQPPAAVFAVTGTDLAITVDGSASSDADGSVTGFEWDFGDGTQALGPLASHTYASAGSYPVTLMVTDNKGATDTATEVVVVVGANEAPVASFASSVVRTKVSFDATESSDSDGSVVGYAWDFGDGSSGVGAGAVHTYAVSGSYTVVLTVTDDDGATGSVSKVVTVVANQAPVAGFTSSVSSLSVDVDGSGSVDPDGSVVSYAWDFGDGVQSSGVSASHVYGADGTYTVRLTVTDNEGATGVVARSVVVAKAVASVLASDGFGRSVSGGWGTADTGGVWSVLGGASRFSVDGSSGVQQLTAGATASSVLSSVSSSSSDAQVVVSSDKAPNATSFVYLQGRRVASGDAYSALVKISASGLVQLHVSRPGGSVGGVVSGLTYAAGDRLHLRVQVEGVSPTVVRAKVWKDGQPEPVEWMQTMTDSTASLQVPGSVAVSTYLSASATNGPILFRYDDLNATTVSTENAPPSAAFTSSPSGLVVAFDASPSTDPDGAVVSVSWAFGDGTTDTGMATTHSYLVAGTYPVTVTITDDDGAQSSTTQTVTVEDPAQHVLAADTFLRTVVNGWGTADIGGAWATSGLVDRFQVADEQGLLALRPGDTVSATLTSVTSSDTRLQFALGFDQRPTGGGLQTMVQTRRVSNSVYYGARVKVLADGTVQVHLARSGSLLSGGQVSGLTVEPGDELIVLTEVFGSSPTTLRVKVWKVGQLEPTSWFAVTTDGTTGLQVGGSPGLQCYLSASSVPVGVRIDDVNVAAV